MHFSTDPDTVIGIAPGSGMATSSLGASGSPGGAHGLEDPRARARERASPSAMRRVRKLAVWLLAAYGAQAVLGEVWGRVATARSPSRMPSFVAQQLSDELRSSRDSATSIVPVMWRPWWTPAPVTGVLATTSSRRVLYIGVVPTLLPPPRVGAEPPATEEWSAAFDSTSLQAGRSLLTGRRTLTLATHDHHVRFDVWAADRSTADTMAAGLARWQDARRLAADHQRVVREEAAELARAPIYHRVARGETLTGVAQRLAVSVDSLRRINHLTTDRIRAGDSLLIKPQY
jgi:LysM repeat protein